jgi:anti-sigma regulatory factor (Ser/Thr protein kinase)
LLKAARAVCHNQAILYEADFFLNGNLRELERLTEEIGRFCAAHSLGEQVAFDLNLVLEELFVNTVRHGGCEGMDQAARVRLRRGELVEVEFSDRGRPFNPTLTAAPDLDAPLDERSGGGLGIHLVRQIMRDLEYSRVNEWNRLTMKRKERTV